jgi:sterol desaturase/sphingolipid hydroxylase (fatty acid hydroxylase superfamily)
MNDFIITNEAIIRLSAFFSIITIMAIWETLKPLMTLTISKKQRWINNFGLVVLNSIILRILFPTAAVGAAIFAMQHGWGLFNNITLPLWITVIISLIIMDMVIYFQHRIFHKIPMLWRLHLVHHADLNYDLSTGLRFHPIEIVLSMLIKFAIILILGIPIVAVIIFEIILNSLAIFNHSNISFPKKLDRILRWFIVTPNMHRVHHSVEFDETNSNYGFNLSWWDRLFKTYRQQTRAAPTNITIGLSEYRKPQQVYGLIQMLRLPFYKK